MSSLDYLDLQIIPLPSLLARISNIYCLIIPSIGVIACVWLLLTNLFKTHSASTKLLLSTIFADFIFLGTTVINSITNQINDGFSLGKLGCLITYFCLITPACVSIATLGVVAWERYQIVCRGNQWSDLTINVWIAALWGSLGLVIGIPLITSNYLSIRLEPNAMNCNVSWYDRSPQSRFMSAFIILMAGITYIVVFVSYYNVYKTFRAATKNKKSKEDNQRMVFYKCVSMTLCLVVSWTPYYTKIFYEFISGKSTNADWACIGSVSGLSCSILNPIILCLYDNRVRGNMLSVFRSFRKVPAPALITESTDQTIPMRTVQTVIL